MMHLFIYFFNGYISSFMEPESMLLRSGRPPLDYKNFKLISYGLTRYIFNITLLFVCSAQLS
jgi:hypothetical protein